MKITIITAVFNRENTLATAIESVYSQRHPEIEYITVDGMSSDGTPGVIESFSSCISTQIREPDSGIYDALNKGIQAASGDIVGFVHADDLLASNTVIEKVAAKFENGNYDAVYGDLVYVNADRIENVVRYWRSGAYRANRFRRGWMPPHPTLYVRKEAYEKFGGYRTDLGSAADYECMIRLLYKNKLRVGYIPDVMVKMRTGGASNESFRNRLVANQSDRQAWIENGLKPPWGLRFTKPLSKIPQYFLRPPSV